MSAPVQRRQLAELIYLDEFRPPADLLEVPQPPAGEAGKRLARRATLAVCWQRSQLRRDLLEVGYGLGIGAVLLAFVLYALSVAGWLPA